MSSQHHALEKRNGSVGRIFPTKEFNFSLPVFFSITVYFECKDVKTRIYEKNNHSNVKQKVMTSFFRVALVFRKGMTLHRALLLIGRPARYQLT